MTVSSLPPLGFFTLPPFHFSTFLLFHCPLRALPELDVVQTAIEGAARHQFEVGANIDHASRIHDQYPIGQRERGKSMRDDDGGALWR